TATTTGCTTVTDFSVEAKAVDGKCQVAIVRKVPDLCQAAAAPFDVEMTWDVPADCEGLPVEILNPTMPDGDGQLTLTN
ncbi:MAG: hypothetical protein AAF499_09895, partial [Pseudomonadota bacterium]